MCMLRRFVCRKFTRTPPVYEVYPPPRGNFDRQYYFVILGHSRPPFKRLYLELYMCWSEGIVVAPHFEDAVGSSQMRGDNNTFRPTQLENEPLEVGEVVALESKKVVGNFTKA